jgi:hypothetical protein
MAQPPPDSLLERPGVGPADQHVVVVIGLHDENLASAQPLDDERGGVAQIGRDPDAYALRFEHERDGVDRVVGNRERIDPDAVGIERDSRLERVPRSEVPRRRFNASMPPS